jgi:amidase
VKESLPAGSVPAETIRDGLPVGLQIVAPRFEEPKGARPFGWPPQAT